MDLELLLNKDSSCSSHEIPTTRQSMPPDTAKNAAIAFEPDSGHVCEGKEQCASSPDEACEAAEPDAAAANLWCPEAFAYEYMYEPGDPVNLEQIATVTSTLAAHEEDLPTELLLANPYLAAFVEGMCRISPHCDEAAREAIAVMQEKWQARISRPRPPRHRRCAGPYTMEEEMQASRLAAKMGISIKEYRAVVEHSRNLRSRLPLDPSTTLFGRPGGSASGTVAARKLPEVDNRERPYAAWMSYERKDNQVLAAARYIEQFPRLRMRLQDDPALEKQARRHAFQLLYLGGEGNIYVANLFFLAFEKQRMLEQTAVIVAPPKGDEISSKHAHTVLQDAEDSDFEYFLSEGEEEADFE